jgi:hypothetical protein
MRAAGIPATLSTAMQANLMGFPLDFMVPSAYLGGEPLKMLYIANVCHVPPQRVLATIIVAKFQEFGGLILGMIVTTAYFIWHTDAFATLNAVLLIILLVILVGLLGITLYTFVGRFKPMVTLLTYLARWRIFHQNMVRLQAFVEELERRISLQYLRQLGGVACMVHAPKCSHVGHGLINQNRRRHFRKPCEGFHHILPAPEHLFCQP